MAGGRCYKTNPCIKLMHNNVNNAMYVAIYCQYMYVHIINVTLSHLRSKGFAVV